MRVFAVASEMTLVGVLVVAASAFRLSVTPFPGLAFGMGTQMRTVGPILLSGCWQMFWVSGVPAWKGLAVGAYYHVISRLQL